MKKHLLLPLILSVSSFIGFAQNQPQVPNGDFEEWVSFTHCSGIDSLVNFYTPDVDYYYFTKEQSGTSSCLSAPTTIKSTDKYSGTYALKLIPVPIVGLPNTYSGNAVLLSKYIDLENNPTGVTFNGKPTKLIGYYKFNRAGTDTLGIEVSTSTANATEPILYGTFTTTASKTTYTKFEIDLQDFDETNQSTATVLDLLISFGNTQGYSNSNSYVIIDALSFEYATTTSTTNYTSTSPINVYAANKNINFSENVSDIHIVDMIGAQKITEISDTKILNISSLPAGMYIVTYKYNDAYFSKKVVIE